jgi:hypothetical protein
MTIHSYLFTYPHCSPIFTIPGPSEKAMISGKANGVPPCLAPHVQPAHRIIVSTRSHLGTGHADDRATTRKCLLGALKEGLG